MILDGYRGAWETQETDDLRDLARGFFAKEIVPHEARGVNPEWWTR